MVLFAGRQWGALVAGAFGGLIGPLAVGLAFLPGSLFSLPAAYLDEKGLPIARDTCMFLSIAYEAAVLSAWCTAVLVFFAGRANSPTSLGTLLFWSHRAPCVQRPGQ
jgi:hypothetical protein